MSCNFKEGDLIQTQTGHVGLIVAIELMYPRHPDSPARMFDVMWTSGARMKMGLRSQEEFGKVSPFSVKKVISRA